MQEITRTQWEKLGAADKAATAKTHIVTDDARPSTVRVFSADLWRRLPPAAQDMMRSQGARVDGEARSATPPPGFIAAPDGIGFLRAPHGEE
jgi:hypothetical protein